MKKILLTTLFVAAAHLAPTVCAAAGYPLPQLPDGIMPNTEVYEVFVGGNAVPVVATLQLTVVIRRNTSNKKG